MYGKKIALITFFMQDGAYLSEYLIIKDYLIKEKIVFKGNLIFNTSKPDGTFRKLTYLTELHSLGWHYTVEIEEGIEKIYKWYRDN